MADLNSSTTISYSIAELDSSAILQWELDDDQERKEELNDGEEYVLLFPQFNSSVHTLDEVNGTLSKRDDLSKEIIESAVFSNSNSVSLRYPKASLVTITQVGDFFLADGTIVAPVFTYDPDTNTIYSSKTGYGAITITYETPYTLFKFKFNEPIISNNIRVGYKDGTIIAFDSQYNLYANLNLSYTAKDEDDEDRQGALLRWEKEDEELTSSNDFDYVRLYYTTEDFKTEATPGRLNLTSKSIPAEEINDLLSFNNSSSVGLSFPGVASSVTITPKTDFFNTKGEKIQPSFVYDEETNSVIIKTQVSDGTTALSGSFGDTVFGPDPYSAIDLSFTVARSQQGASSSSDDPDTEPVNVFGIVLVTYTPLYNRYQYFYDRDYQEADQPAYKDGFLIAFADEKNAYASLVVSKSTGEEDSAGYPRGDFDSELSLIIESDGKFKWFPPTVKFKINPSSPAIQLTVLNASYKSLGAETETIEEYIEFSGQPTATLSYVPEGSIAVTKVGDYSDLFGRRLSAFQIADPNTYVVHVVWTSSATYIKEDRRKLRANEIGVIKAGNSLIPCYGIVKVTYNTSFDNYRLRFNNRIFVAGEGYKYLPAFVLARRPFSFIEGEVSQQSTATLRLNPPSIKGR